VNRLGGRSIRRRRPRKHPSTVEERKSHSENENGKCDSREDQIRMEDSLPNDNFTTPSSYNPNAKEVDSHTELSTRRRRKNELPLSKSATWDSFMPMYFLSEARSELGEKKKHMETPIPPKPTLISLRETGSKEGTKESAKQPASQAAAILIQRTKRKQIVIRLMEEPARQSNLNSESATSIVKPSTSLANSTPTPSIDSVDETTYTTLNALPKPCTQPEGLLVHSPTTSFSESNHHPSN
jgi:hypothetical protein